MKDDGGGRRDEGGGGYTCFTERALLGVARSSLRFFSAVGGCGQGQEADFQPNNEVRQIFQIQLRRPTSIRPINLVSDSPHDPRATLRNCRYSLIDLRQ